jgi:hypothetical protein
MVRALAEAMVWDGRIEATNRWVNPVGSTAQHPPRRSQDQEQAAAEDEKAGGHGVLSLKRAFTGLTV